MDEALSESVTMLECLIGLLAISSRVEVINVPHTPSAPTVMLLIEPLDDVTAAQIEAAKQSCKEVQLAIDFDRDLPYTSYSRKNTGEPNE